MTEEDRQYWLRAMKKIKMSVDAGHELTNALYAWDPLGQSSLINQSNFRAMATYLGF